MYKAILNGKQTTFHKWELFQSDDEVWLNTDLFSPTFERDGIIYMTECGKASNMGTREDFLSYLRALQEGEDE